MTARIGATPRHLLLQCLSFGLIWSCAAQTPSLTPAPDNSLIRASGTAPVYLLRNGRKYHIQTPNWITKNGYNISAIRELSPSDVSAIPTSYILTDDARIPGTLGALDRRLVLGSDGKIYLVKDGQRHWILSPEWIAHSSYAGQVPIFVPDAELENIPLANNYAYTPLGKRILSILPLIVLFLSLFAFFFLSVHDDARNVLRSYFLRFTSDAFSRSWKPSYTRSILFLAFAFTIAVREPYLLTHPRFWAEEGTTWFQFASSHSIMQTLLYIYPPSGYLNLCANIGAVLSSRTATWLGIEHAPAASTLFAFVIQLLSIGLILFGKSHLFDSLWKAIVGCLIVVFASTTVDEIWLNTINSMSFLGLISLIILFTDTRNSSSWMRWGLRGLLVLGGLSSPYAAALAPLFVVSSIRNRDREPKIQCLILVVCVVFQAGTVARGRIHAGSNGGLDQFNRATDVHLDTSLVNVFFGQMATPALGFYGEELLINELGARSAWTSSSSRPPRPVSASLLTAGWLCFVLIAITLWHLRGPTIFATSNLLIAAFLSLAVLTCATSLYSVPLGRYAFLPGLTFLFVLLSNCETAKSPAVRYGCAIVLAYGLAVGILDYRSHPFQAGPDWSTEVTAWRKNHAYVMRVWPAFWNNQNRGVTYSAPAGQ